MALVKPELFLDEVLSDMPWPTRYFYLGLVAIADRDGTITASPKSLKARLMPFDDGNANEMITDLITIGYLTQSNGVIQLVGFEKKPRGRKPKSDSPQETIEDF